ncbi:MAG: heavy-metal-associated domain-containing protein [Flavobacteriaceae bacterium]|jgi:copper chaperone CopZ|nr:heavy-metal-associated domain-containing protein [Flavobacteriaceae bacterium]
MKKINKYLFVIAFTLVSIFNVNSQIIKAEIRATGLTCSMCSNAINKQLKSLSEVANVETDLNTNTFLVTLTENSNINPSDFKQSVEKAGFFIGSLVITSKTSMINKENYIVVGTNNIVSDEITFQVLDKGYVTDKEFKKISKSLKKIESYLANNENDFHIKLIK